MPTFRKHLGLGFQLLLTCCILALNVPHARAADVVAVPSSVCEQTMTPLLRHLQESLDDDAAAALNSAFTALKGQPSDVTVRAYVNGSQVVLLVSQIKDEISAGTAEQLQALRTQELRDSPRFIDGRTEPIAELKHRKVEITILKVRAGFLAKIKWLLGFLALKPAGTSWWAAMPAVKNHLPWISDTFRDNIHLFNSNHWKVIAVGNAISLPLVACAWWVRHRSCKISNMAKAAEASLRTEANQAIVAQLDEELEATQSSHEPIVVLTDDNGAQDLQSELLDKRFTSLATTP